MPPGILRLSPSKSRFMLLNTEQTSCTAKSMPDALAANLLQQSPVIGIWGAPTSRSEVQILA
eukprot:scaffold112867_cov13-Tisochrysis_lutea.AAC.1